MRSSKGFTLQPIQPTASPAPRSSNGLPPKGGHRLPTNAEFETDRVSASSKAKTLMRTTIHVLYLVYLSSLYIFVVIDWLCYL